MVTRKRDKDGLFQRRKGGNWYVQRHDKRVSLGTRDKEVARRKLRDHELAAVDPTFAAAREAVLDAVASDWLAAIIGRPKPPKPGTLEMYRQHLAHFVRILGADFPLVRVGAPALDEYFRARRSEAIGKRNPRPVSAETLVKERGTWLQLLRYAARTRRYPHVPEIELPRMASDYKPLTRALTEAELPRLLAVLSPSRRAIVCFLAGLGADWCAVGTSELGDFEPRPNAPVIGPTAPPVSVLVRGTKNPGRWRRVPVVPPFLPLVAGSWAWLAEYGRFVPWLRGNRTRDLAAACKRAGVPRVTPRDLRRTFGRILRARGVPPALLGDMLRHSDGGRTAARVYGQLEPEDLGRLVAAVTGTEPVQLPAGKNDFPGKSGI